MFNNLSILMCSYNTPSVTLTCLKSLIYNHTDCKFNLLISENSTDNETEELLNKNNVPYFRNKGMKHCQGVDFLIRKCKTDYALLIDSDIIFHKNILPLWDTIKNIDFALAGERCGDRGGKLLYPRIHPWFCFLNIKHLKEHNLSFGDDESLNVGKDERLWDVGSTIYNNALKAKLNIIDMEKDMESYFYHYEGMSWRKNVTQFREWGLAVEQAYQKEIIKYQDISMEEKWIY